MYAKTFVDQITASEMESKRSGHAVNKMKKVKYVTERVVA
jgi:hypothetical protein